MSFAAPVLLLFLLAVPAAVAGYVWLERRRESRAAGWATPSLLPNLVERPPSWRRHLPTALLLAGVALLLVGFARPRTSVSVKRQDATVVLVLDVSGSMAAKDAKPTRLGAARTAALQFVDKLPKGYRMSLVTFSDHAAVVVPATHDLSMMRSAIARAKSGPQGTALAEAVSRAVDVGVSVKGQAQGQRGPRRSSSCSPTVARPPAGSHRLRPPRRPGRRASLSRRSPWGRRTVSCCSRCKAGSPNGSRSPRNRRRCSRSQPGAAAASIRASCRRREDDLR